MKYIMFMKNVIKKYYIKTAKLLDEIKNHSNKYLNLDVKVLLDEI